MNVVHIEEDKTMKKSVTSKEELCRIARDIARREGIGKLSIRRLADENDIAIGTVYNYYPSKEDLIAAIMEDFWREVFHNNHFDTESHDFIGSWIGIYERLGHNLKSFREEFLNEMVISHAGRKRGKELEFTFLNHMKESLLRILERDDRVGETVWDDTFTPRRFVDFAFSHMMLLLREQEDDPAYFEEIMKRLIYL